MSMTQDYLFFPGSTKIKKVLKLFEARDGKWWWLLVTERDDGFYVCSFGSLLPYLTGRTEHIVHRIGDCPICSSMDPVLWRQTDKLVNRAQANPIIRQRLVSELPMAPLPTVEAGEISGSSIGGWTIRRGLRVCGITESGALTGMYVAQTRGDPGRMPEF